MTTRVKILLVLSITFFGACKEARNKPHQKRTTQVDCIPYFQFDEIDHYFYDIGEEEIMNIWGKETKTQKEKKQVELLIDDTPDELKDTGILHNIEKTGFLKKEIPATKFQTIDEIFCEREHTEIEALACIAIYRDILVFKKKNRIIGTAKICFSCGQHVITGTTRITDAFGQSGDYEKLYHLLHTPPQK